MHVLRGLVGLAILPHGVDEYRAGRGVVVTRRCDGSGLVICIKC